MYDHKSLESKWKKFWKENNIYRVGEDTSKPKYYILDMFPYPSGSGLHVGHPKGYIATDILARLKIMQNYNVLHPMGWDAFGLPAENFALKNKVHPRVATQQNVATYKRQLESLGFSYDWEREINTTDPEFYRWTQWMFLKMFEHGLVFESQEPINWCPSCKTGLANEDLEDGKCERCGSEIEMKPLRQWVIRITKYADRLLDDLEKLPDWEDSIKEMQRNWIGRSEGAEIEFSIKDNDKKINVFTTRVDTIFGCTYVVLAPENGLIDQLKEKIENWEELVAYRETIKSKSALERTDLNKDKTGVILRGIKALNPFSNEEVDVFAADYVLNNYGTGAVMAVPAHDDRDFEFAKKYDLKIKTVIISESANPAEHAEAFVVDGKLIGSGDFSGLTSFEARKQMIAWLEKSNCGGGRVNYKIKDWVFSRQRYWGEPIPLVYCPSCAARIKALIEKGENPVDHGFNQGEALNPGTIVVPDDQLPLTLPEVESYEPSGNGESPLANITDWVNVACPHCGAPAKRETNTMPQWAGSSWYYLRYIDPHNKEKFADAAKEKYWSPVDFYVGGAEHATRHLIYARFWHKFLYDIGAVSQEEPFRKLQHVGLIMGEDGRKMSKRWGNVINPDDIVEKFGADSLRVYEMFMSPFSESCAWNTNGLVGARKFLDRVTNIQITDNSENKILKSVLHKTIKKIGEDIEAFKFNTAIAQMMIFVNAVYENKSKDGQVNLDRDDFRDFVKILSPFAPHLAEELWSQSGGEGSIFKQSWPKYDENLIKDETISLVVQINGKVRTNIDVAADINEDEAKNLVMENSIVQKWIEGKEIVKIIFVKGKLLNIVIK